MITCNDLEMKKDDNPRRGFVTIATGAERYYKLALNLLQSYRFHAKCPEPFAIICDRENEYTPHFDYVVLLSNPCNSYNDKLRLYDCLPFDETIFIDADSLAYGDLNDWWDMFTVMDDFCVFGYACRDLSATGGWFRPEGMKEYADRVTFIPSYNGGVYYMRKTEKCAEVFRIAQYCAEHYSDYAFCGFKKPADEPVLALGMAVCGCEPLNEKELIFAPQPSAVDLDILQGIARRQGEDHNYHIVHWSNYLTLKSWYRFETGRLRAAVHGWPWPTKLFYQKNLAKMYLWVADINAFLFRARRKAKQTWKQFVKSYFSSKN